jgi:hypothetical protein
MFDDFSIGNVGSVLTDVLGVRAQERVAVADAERAQLASDRAFAQAQAARSYVQENQRSLLIMSAAAVILFALVWRSGK